MNLSRSMRVLTGDATASDGHNWGEMKGAVQTSDSGLKVPLTSKR
jgi:hypothetical protein